MPQPIYSEVGRRATPQTEPASAAQVKNSAGGFTFAIDDAARLRRFLILGTEGGTYYASARDLTLQNVEVVERMALADPARAVEIIREVSVGGRAPKVQPALLALAIVASSPAEGARALALEALPAIVRTGSHMLTFVSYVEHFRGWGRGLKRAVRSWYERPDVDALAYQMAKYRQRGGWAQGDVLRLSRPRAVSPAHADLFSWTLGKPEETPHLPAIARALDDVQHASVAEAVDLIGSGSGLSWEMLPDRLLTEPTVWEALLAAGVPVGALLRQLPRLTRLGLTAGDTGRTIVDTLTDPERLRRARIHPLNVLVGLKTYAAGHSLLGSGAWQPARRIIDALDSTFYASFGFVEPTGKRTLLGLDFSGSMGSLVAGMPISAREAVAAMAMVTARTEDEWEAVAFTASSHIGYGYGAAALAPVTLSPRQRMDDVLAKSAAYPFGRTDCSLPMTWALEQRKAFDLFVIYTDNETYAGRIHPHQALREYREKMGIDARLVVVGMTSTGFSIADPSDPGMLDVVGFDTAAPNLISEFARG